MTGNLVTISKTKKKTTRFPDFPPRQDMQNWLFLYRRSFPAALATYLGNYETTIVASELPVAPTLDNWLDVRIPDLFVSYNASLELFKEQNGYAIDREGKPPEFVLEVASPSTGINDYTEKRSDYERYGVLEYWRFDASGGVYHDASLAGDYLVDGKYEPIEIEWLDDNRCRGYSDALGLHLCWEYGELRWFDPVSENYLQTYEEVVEQAERAEAELQRLRAQLGTKDD